MVSVVNDIVQHLVLDGAFVPAVRLSHVNMVVGAPERGTPKGMAYEAVSWHHEPTHPREVSAGLGARFDVGPPGGVDRSNGCELSHASRSPSVAAGAAERSQRSWLGMCAVPSND
jgi:hypothetical protein